MGSDATSTKRRGRADTGSAAPADAAPSEDAAAADSGNPAGLIDSLYRRLAPLDAGRHAALGLTGEEGFAFAAGVIAVPVNLVEFGMAAKHYPILFSEEDPPTPFVLTGIHRGRNLFVDGGGRWRAGAYVPALLRRYPFLLVRRPGTDQAALCIDEDASLVGENAGRPLFEEGEPTELVQEALKFCESFLRHAAITESFARALAAQDILVGHHADFRFADGRVAELKGFKVIDEERFAALPDEVFLDWRGKGWLTGVYAQLLSASNWRPLVALAG